MNALDVAAYDPALKPFNKPLVAEDLLTAAETATGLSEWGTRRWGEEGFRHRFGLLCDSLEREAGLTPRGRSRARSRLHVMLCSRLRYLAYRNAHPGLDAERIVRPLIGSGMPRTGTTLLHGLLSQDPANRSPRTWEIAIPTPAPEPAGYQSDPRIALYQSLLAFQGFDDPALNAIHAYGAERPEECIWMQEGACGPLYNTFFNAPAFREHGGLDPAEGYAWQIGQLQVLQSRMDAKRWSLKAPPHIFTWDAMWIAFPDARVYMNHRDPAKVLPSIVSLVIGLKRLFTEAAIDPAEEARQRVARFSAALEANIEWRAAHPDAAIVDVRFGDLVSRPIETVASLYDAFELPLSREAADRMKRFLDAERHGARPTNAVSLADVGLSPADIDAAFGRYMDHFQVEREGRA